MTPPGRVTLAVAVLAALIWGGARWWVPGDEAAVRATLARLAEGVSAPAGDPPLARAARLGGLRDDVTPDVVVDGPGGLRVEGADRVVGMAAARWQDGGGVELRLEDLDVTLASGGASADVRGVAELRGRGGDRDARDVAFTLTRGDDGRWRVAHVTVDDPLERPAPAR